MLHGFKLRRLRRPDCSRLDPRNEVGHLIGLQSLLFLRRHRGDIFLPLNRANEQTLFRLARHDRRSGGTPLEQHLARIDAQLTGLLRVTVTAQTRLDQDRPNLRLEEVFTVVRTVARRQQARHQHRA